MDRGCGCGVRRFASELLAGKALAKGAALPGADASMKLAPCPRRAGVWHLATAGRHETFPPAAAALITARDPWCVLCGSPRGLHLHHRRIRGTGGDPRPHAGCACNGVRLCWRDHAWIHDTGVGRGVAGDEGLIVPRAALEPGRVSVLVHLEDDRGGMRKWPSCDGRWLDQQPPAVAA